VRIVVGITGGIAAYKVPSLIRLLCKEGIDVRVVLTSNAVGFVGPEALRTLSGHPVYHDSQSHGTGSPYLYPGALDHIRLAEWADFLLIVPATANTIAKLARGIADNLLTTLALSFQGDRLIIAPAMNTVMWRHPATIENIRILSERKARILPVEEGELACGTQGPGRLLAVEEIVATITGLRTHGPLSGRRVLISSGPTAEPLDPVRVITNRSSGKMGAALAQAALDLGARVTVVAGPQAAPLPDQAHVVNVATAVEMQAALAAEFDDCDACIMAAAVGDFRAAAVAAGKIPRVAAGETTLRLVPNPDILKSLTSRKEKQFVVGFSLESDGNVSRAQKKMADKRCDLMVLNTVADALGGDDTSIVILGKSGEPETFGPASKAAAARHLLSRIAREMGPPHA